MRGAVQSWKRLKPTTADDFDMTLDLWEALRLIVHLTEKRGPEMAGMMRAPRWAFYDHPTSIQGSYGSKGLRLFRPTQRAEERARARLNALLKAGQIRGTALVGGERRRIADEWATHRVEVASSSLLPPYGFNQIDFPPAASVRVWREDIERLCSHGDLRAGTAKPVPPATSEPRPSAPSIPAGRPKRNTGPKPVKSEGLTAAMRRDVERGKYTLEALESWTYEALAAEYGASRNTASAALHKLIVALRNSDNL